MATKKEIITKAQAEFAKTQAKGLQQISKIKDPQKKQAQKVQLDSRLDKIHAKADTARGVNTFTGKTKSGDYVQLPTSVKAGSKFTKIEPATPTTQTNLQSKTNTLTRQSSLRFGVNPAATKEDKAKVAERNKNILAKETKDSATARGIAGYVSGFSPTKAEFAPEVQKNLKDSTAFKVGEFAGIGTQFALPYGGLGKGAVAATTKVAPRLLPTIGKVGAKGIQKIIPKVGEEAAAKFGTRAAESLVKDIVIGAPLNFNQAYNKDDLRGKELAKSMAANTALDIGVGGAIEAAPAIIKSLKGSEKIPVIKNGKVEYEAKPTVKAAEKTVEKATPTLPKKLVKQANPTSTATEEIKTVQELQAQALNQTVEPQKTVLGTNTPQEQIITQNTPLNQPIKDLGADTNKTVRTLVDDIERSGELSEGIPNNTPYGDVSRHAKTINEGEQYSKGTVTEMLKSVEDGGFGKYTKTNATAMQNANDTLKNIDDAYVKFKSVLKNNKQATSEDLALGYQLAKHFDDSGDYLKASEILEDTTFILSETGRTLQAARLAMKNSPLGRQRIASKIAKKVSEKTGVEVKLSDESLGKIYNAKSEKEIEKAFEDVKFDLWNQVPPTFVDKFNAWRYTAMLGNSRTIIKNELGNAFSYLAKEFKDTLGTGIEKAVLKPGERTKSILTPKDRDLINAGKEYAKEYMNDLQGAGKFSDINTGSRPQEIPVFGQQNNIISKTLGKGVEAWRTTTNKALNDGLFGIIKGDEGWLTTVYGNAFAKVLKANKWTLDQVKNSPQLFNAVHEIAKTEAQRATFRDASEFAQGLNRISSNLRNSKNMLKKAAGYGIEGAIPFKKTPVNILKRSIEYSPAGLVNGAYKFAKAIKTGNDIPLAIDRLSAGLTGTGVALLGAYLSSQGILTVSVKNDKQGNYDKMQGKQPYSLNVSIGGKDYSYTIDWLSPTAVPLFLGAETYKSLSEKGATTSDIINSFSNMVDPVFEMSMLQGLSNLLDVDSYGDGNTATKIGKAVGNLGFSLAGQTVPTLLGQASRIADPINRRTNSSDQQGDVENYIGYNFNKNILSKLPVLNQNRQEYVDQWGRTQKKNSNADYVSSAVQNLISPGFAANKNTTNVDREITSVYSQNKNNKILPSIPSGYDVTFKGQDYRMKSDEMVQFKKTVGNYAYQGLGKLFDTSEYKSMSTEDKEKAISNIYEEANKKAKNDFLKTQGFSEKELWLKGTGKTAKKGFDVVKKEMSAETFYNDYYKAQKGYKSDVAKSMALLPKPKSQEVLKGMDISNKSIIRAQRLLNSGITADEYTRIKKEANVDGGDLKKAEVRKYINQSNYTSAQKLAILISL